ncbi:DUF3558 domain-containing protein [Streptomyces narbonensis]|uniref:DUF3558 domain-containing protein n=1 Tax=Streptomyces narbonensis TaxID=67333 RepID=UPI00167A840B|nr:DUF3558 domain-containing protein [Streptomyces narbonensis]GGW12227.1 hypothetical protein GCM10010230_67130 [Streptomyces narbonensis]
MQRKRYAPGRTGSTARTAVVLTSVIGLGLGLGLTGCSAGPTTDDLAVDAKAGPVSPVAPPGRYRTLFEPCGAVPQATLKDLLPGAAALPDAERGKAYRGVAAVTYDTDRRVGCTWKADSPETSHRLALDIERVVSYDPAVSDDSRAQEVYLRKQLAAGIPVPPTTPPTPTGTATGTASGTATPPPANKPSTPSTPGAKGTTGTPSATAPTGKTPTAPASGAPSGGTPSTTPTPASTGLEPRVLEGLGEIAYLDDALSTVGASGHQRVVSVVFRTSNVIVTVSYREQTTGSAAAPDSQELQERARNLARKLAERLEE